MNNIRAEKYLDNIFIDSILEQDEIGDYLSEMPDHYRSFAEALGRLESKRYQRSKAGYRVDIDG
jgi:hypothetical protein